MCRVSDVPLADSVRQFELKIAPFVDHVREDPTSHTQADHLATPVVPAIISPSLGVRHAWHAGGEHMVRVLAQRLCKHVVHVLQECTSGTRGLHFAILVEEAIINQELGNHLAFLAHQVAIRKTKVQRASPLARCARRASINHTELNLHATFVVQDITNPGRGGRHALLAQVEQQVLQKVPSLQARAKNARLERMVGTLDSRPAMRAVQTTISRTVAVRAASAAHLVNVLRSREQQKRHNVRIVSSMAMI